MHKTMKRLVLPAALSLSAAVLSVAAFGACTVNTASVAFGNYDVFAGASTDSTGNISVSCDTSTSYSIALSAGSGSISARTLTGTGSTLYYNLYADPARTLVWGDGSGGSTTVSNTAISGSHTVYGRIPAGQNVTAGTYTDTLVITVTF